MQIIIDIPEEIYNYIHNGGNSGAPLLIDEAIKNGKLLAEEHWIGYWDEESRCYKYKCSKCGNEQPFDTEFYWTCGTDMRGRSQILTTEVASL